MIRGYVITADHETARAANVQDLLTQLPQLKTATAIYPAKDRVPFAKSILAKAKRLARWVVVLGVCRIYFTGAVGVSTTGITGATNSSSSAS